jgi:hypothetical protein
LSNKLQAEALINESQNLKQSKENDDVSVEKLNIGNNQI